jgi:hypothetical protein
LWDRGNIPSYGKFREHIEEETDTVFGSCSRAALLPAHLKGLPVMDNTGRFAPGSGEHGRFSATDWKPDPVRQELEADKKKQAWELPAGQEAEKEAAQSVYGDAEEHVDGRSSHV